MLPDPSLIFPSKRFWTSARGACRLIFPSIADLMAFRANLHKAHFHHILKKEQNTKKKELVGPFRNGGKYDYITTPRSSGYRGIHDIYSYNVNSINQHLSGLLIEFADRRQQYRTQCQHAWAIASKLIGLMPPAANRNLKEGIPIIEGLCVWPAR